MKDPSSFISPTRYHIGPTILVAPGHAPPGSVIETPIISTDWFPTLLELVDQPLKPHLHRDGVSIVPLLRNESISPRSIFWHYPHYGAQHGAPFGAVRSGDWKLIEWYEGNVLELFNLRDDPNEQSNLAKEIPELAATLHQQLMSWRVETNAIMPIPNPDYSTSRDRALKQV